MDKPNDRGVYRSIPVRIMGASHQPPQPYLVEPNMLDLMQSNEKRKQTMHPIVRMALFHLEFEGIHPFVDGNGRTGRLLINLELMRTSAMAIPRLCSISSQDMWTSNWTSICRYWDRVRNSNPQRYKRVMQHRHWFFRVQSHIVSGW
jgi:Fic family protein